MPAGKGGKAAVGGSHGGSGGRERVIAMMLLERKNRKHKAERSKPKEVLQYGTKNLVVVSSKPA